MGCYKPCYSTNPDLGSSEIAVLELYDEQDARDTAPGFDDLLGEPILEDNDNDGVGERVRPGQVIKVNAKIKPVKYDEQNQDGIGNDPESMIEVTFYEANLIELGLLVNGVCEIRANDRLLRVENPAGDVRIDFEYGLREGLFCYNVTPGETGTGIYTALFERRRRASK